MSKIMPELKYTKSHEWLKEDGDVAYIGISDFAQDALGDLVFINLPEEGDSISAGEAFADVESVKAVSDIISPADGEVVEVNEEVIDNPALINEDAFGAWLVKIANFTPCSCLIDAAAYEEFCASEEA